MSGTEPDDADAHLHATEAEHGSGEGPAAQAEEPPAVAEVNTTPAPPTIAVPPPPPQQQQQEQMPQPQKEERPRQEELKSQPRDRHSALHRLEQWAASGAPQRAAMLRAAMDGGLDIVDDYFDSCRSVVLFELWKGWRLALWSDWLKQLRQNVHAFDALQDRQAFAGSVYTDASILLKKQVAADRRKRKDAVAAADKERSAFIASLHRPPMFLQRTHVHGSECESLRVHHNNRQTQRRPPHNTSNIVPQHSGGDDDDEGALPIASSTTRPQKNKGTSRTNPSAFASRVLSLMRWAACESPSSSMGRSFNSSRGGEDHRTAVRIPSFGYDGASDPPRPPSRTVVTFQN